MCEAYMTDHVPRDGQKLMVITLFRVTCRTAAETTVKAKSSFSSRGLTTVVVSGLVIGLSETVGRYEEWIVRGSIGNAIVRRRIKNRPSFPLLRSRSWAFVIMKVNETHGRRARSNEFIC